MGTSAGAGRSTAKGASVAKGATKATGSKGGREKPPGWPKWGAAFLKQLEHNGGHVSNAAEKSGVTRQTAYKRRFACPAFAEKWDEARRIGQASIIDRIEDNALLRAAEGVREPVGFYQGTAAEYVVRHSEQLVLAMLRALRPRVYNIAQGDLTAGGSAITAEQQAAKIRAFVQAMDGSVPTGPAEGDSDAE